MQQFNQLNQRHLSPAQQGHILSDVQQHQHRFNVHQSTANGRQTFPHQQFVESVRTGIGQVSQSNVLKDQYLSQQNFYQNQPVNQQTLNSQTLAQGGVPLLSSALVTQQTLLSTNQPSQNQISQGALPTVPSSINPLDSFNAQENRVLQHHTQTGFSPNYKNQQLHETVSSLGQLNAHQQLFQATSNPLFNVQPSQPLDPEQQKQRLKEIQEKQAIIDKHNQFVEKQYDKALKKARSDHEEFLKEQQEQRRKLYHKIYKDTSENGPVRYRLNNPRYIYPEEAQLFKIAVQKYYEEHPTTTTTTTTTTTAPTPTTTSAILEKNGEHREGRILNNKNSGEIFLSSQTQSYVTSDQSQKNEQNIPADSSFKVIQSLEDLDQLRDQYKNQKIAKDDLIAQLKLAIGENPEEEIGKNLTSREITLPNRKQTEFIRTTNPKLISDRNPTESISELDKSLQQRITLPNGQEVEVIRTSDPKSIPGASLITSGSDLDELVRQKLNLPDGQKYEILRTNDPKSIPEGATVVSQSQLDELVKQKLQFPSVDQNVDELVRQKLNLPDGQNYEIVRTTDPKLVPEGATVVSKSELDELVKQKLNIPPGNENVQIVSTSDPKLLQGGTPVEANSELDKLVKQKLNLPDGQNYEIIRTSDPKSIPGAIPVEIDSKLPTTTSKPPKEILDELTKGVVPEGTNLEILREGTQGLEQINGFPTNIPNQKKVTFVLLEEQSDGTFKVQGIKGNSEKEKDSVDVDSILKRIEKGEIKLPTPTKKPSHDNVKQKIASSTELNRETIHVTSSTPRPSITEIKRTSFFPPSVTVSPNSFPSSVSFESTTKVKTNIETEFDSSIPESASTEYFKKISTTTHKPSTESSSHEASSGFSNVSNDLLKQASTVTHSNRNSIFTATRSSTRTATRTPSSTSSSPITVFKSESFPTTNDDIRKEDITRNRNVTLPELTEILKKNGLFAMAKFLKQSGLDSILNETGPYTIFAPNDKAFRTLLVQLGGPDKAEEKFKDNPRLLSGVSKCSCLTADL